MENKKELSDLLIGDEEPRRSGSKNTSLVILAAAVFFLMAVLAIYTLTRDGREEMASSPLGQTQGGQLERVENNPSAIPTPPEGNATAEQAPADKEELSSDERFERIVKEIKAKQSAAQSSAPTAQPRPQAAPQQPIPAAVPPSPLKIESSTVRAPAPKPAPVAPTPVRPVQSSPYPTNTTPAAHNGSPATAGFYLQVGSFTKSPNVSFIKTIERNNLTYRFQKDNLNGSEVTRMLIGPYATKGEAANALRLVQEKIEPKAFVKYVN